MRRAAITLGLGTLLVAAVASAAPSNHVVGGDLTVGGDAAIGGDISVGEYTRRYSISAEALVLGPTAPDRVDVGTYSGLGFSSNTPTFRYNYHVANGAWTGTSDINMVIHWTNASGTAVADGETVIWECTYRSRGTGENLTSGDATVATATHTQAGAGTDGENYETTMTLAFSGGDNPIEREDLVGLSCLRDATTDSYGSVNAIIMHLEFHYQSEDIGAD